MMETKQSQVTIEKLIEEIRSTVSEINSIHREHTILFEEVMDLRERHETKLRELRDLEDELAIRIHLGEVQRVL